MRTRTPGQRWFDEPDHFKRECARWRWEQHEQRFSVAMWLPPAKPRTFDTFEQLRRDLKKAIVNLYGLQPTGR